MIDIIQTMCSLSETNVQPTLSSINENRASRGLMPIATWQAFVAFLVATYTVDFLPDDASPIHDVFGGPQEFVQAAHVIASVKGMEDDSFVEHLQNRFTHGIGGSVPEITELTEDGFATGLYVMFVALLKRTEGQ